MARKKEKSGRVLMSVVPEKCFWVYDGQVLKNLRELAGALEKMSDDVFNYHVTKKKNDFANWVSDVFGEEKLAAGLKKAKTAKAAAKSVGTEIG